MMKCGWAGERNLIAKGLVLPKGGRVDPWGENANAQEITVNTGQGGGGVYAVNLRHRAEAPSVSQKPGVVNQIRVMRARPPVRIHRKKKQHEVAPHTRAEDDVRGDGLGTFKTMPSMPANLGEPFLKVHSVWSRLGDQGNKATLPPSVTFSNQVFVLRLFVQVFGCGPRGARHQECI